MPQSLFSNFSHIGPDIRRTTQERIIVLFCLLARSDNSGQALMNPQTLEEAIYKNAPAIEVYRQKIIQFLKQEVHKRWRELKSAQHYFFYKLKDA